MSQCVYVYIQYIYIYIEIQKQVVRILSTQSEGEVKFNTLSNQNSSLLSREEEQQTVWNSRGLI